MQKAKHPPGLSELIIDNYPALSKQQKKIADIIVTNRPSTLVLTGKELAAQAGVSEAAIVRFAKTLGFRGFPQLKAVMIAEFKERFIPKDRFRLIGQASGRSSTLSQIAGIEVENINDTVVHMNPQQFHEFIRRLRRAPAIYPIGIGLGALMAKIAAFWFRAIGIRAFTCPDEEVAVTKWLERLDKNDAVMAFSFPTYSQETIDALKHCYQRGISSLSITDKPTAPIIPWSHAHLVVRSDNMIFANAIGSLTMLLNAIATELALSDKDKADIFRRTLLETNPHPD